MTARTPSRSRRAARRARTTPAERTLISGNDLRKPGTRAAVGSWKAVFLGLLVVVGLYPLFWLVVAATSTTQDTLRDPMGVWGDGIHLDNLWRAWTHIQIDQYTANTFIIAIGTTFFTLLLTMTGAYVLGILRPRYARFVNTAVMATLFIPGVISLVPLYLVIIDLPLTPGQVGIIDTWWAVWLPGSVSAFNILIAKQYLLAIPHEMFEAATIDGAGRIRVFWNIVLPLGRPIMGVIALLTFIASWRDFLWPLLALPSPDKRPLSVALSLAERTTDLSLAMAGMLIATVLPIVLFLVFQRQFLSGVSATGSVKG
jgi:multiple sugar transport system permease protein